MQPDDVIEECVAECDTHYKAATGKAMADVGLDPISIIMAIFAVIAQLCPKPPAELKADAQAKRPRTVLTVRSATRQALREQHPNVIFVYGRYNGDALANAVLASIADKDEMKIQMGLDCCAH